MASKPRTKRVCMWAGYTDNKIFREYANEVHDEYGNIPARSIVLYPNRNAAKTRFEDVRRVEIRQVRREE